jgi:hypothetical protein
MTANPRRPLLVNLTWAGVLLVGLALLYPAAWLLASWSMHNDRISCETAEAVRTAFWPIIRYCDSDLPGSDALTNLWWSVNPQGPWPPPRGTREYTQEPLGPVSIRWGEFGPDCYSQRP